VTREPHAPSPGKAPDSYTGSTESLINAVLAASQGLVAIAARSLSAAPAHVTLAQYRILVVLATRGPQFPTVLAAELGVAGSSITRLCDRLVAKRLIVRETDAANRRQVILSISPPGRSVVHAVLRVRRREIARVIAAVPAARRAQTIEALNELSAAIGEPPQGAWMLGWET